MANEENNFENDDISRLLGSLKQAEPPADFDIRVRARIAQGRPSIRRGWMPVPVAAALLVMIATGYFGFHSYIAPPVPVREASIAPIPMPQPQSPDDAEPPTGSGPYIRSDQDTTNTVASKPAELDPSMTTAKTSARDGSKNTDKERGGGSLDTALREEKPILPRGFNQTNANLKGFQQSGIAVDSLLRQLGIVAVLENGWRVTSVGGAAANSGLKIGDVIEAINGRSLVRKTSLDGTVSAGTIRVRRDDTIITITLRP